MTSVSIGALRHRIAIERPERVGDGGGGATVTWSLVGDVWARITPRSGGEAVTADQIAGRVSHEIVVRYRTDVEPSMRMRFGGRIFEINAVLDVGEQRHFLKCLCREERL